MIRAILALVAWLDKRYPPKVVINADALRRYEADDWNARTLAVVQTQNIEELREQVKKLDRDQLTLAGSSVNIEDFRALSKTVTAIKDALTKSGIGQTTKTAEERAEYIRSGRLP